MRPPIPPSTVALNDRYASQRQAYVQPRMMATNTSPPYLSRRDPGSGLPPGPPGYLPPLPPGVHHHLLPLQPSEYSNRPSGGYVNPSTRPVVIAMPPTAGGPVPSSQRQQQQLRHYSNAARASVAPPSTVSDPVTRQTVYRGTLPASMRMNHNAGPQEPSSSSSMNTQIGESVVELPSSSTRIDLTEEELKAPAIVKAAQQPTPSAVVNKDLEMMTQALKLQQQEWLERTEMKKMFSDLASVLEMIQYLRISETHPEEVLQNLYEILLYKLPQSIDRLRKRTITSIEVLQVAQKDIQSYAHEIAEEIRANETLRSVDLAYAEKNFQRAKRRKQYQQEYEKLAGEIVSKKSRAVCEKELEVEMSKLEEAKKEFVRCKHMNDIRKLQTETALTLVRNLLHNINNPSMLFSVADTINNEKVPESPDGSEMTDDIIVVSK